MGVRRFGALPYAHQAGVATYLNDWARDFAAAHPDNLRSATFYPEPVAAAEVAALVAEGVQVFKVHVQVGDFDLLDPLLDEAWGDHSRSRHTRGRSTPAPDRWRTPTPARSRSPSCCGVILSSARWSPTPAPPSTRHSSTLAERYERVHLDTTMVFTDFFEALAPYPRDLSAAARRVG